MPAYLPLQKPAKTGQVKLYDSWGRVLDTSSYSFSYASATSSQPDHNPDPIDRESQGNRYFKIANNPYVKAGLNFRDISRLFVSAKGLDPDDNGAYFPAQLLYTTDGAQKPLDALAEQYDELFDGGFATILRSLQMPAMEYGRALGEIAWYKEDGKIRAGFIFSRDPQRYLINPPDYKPGIYRKNHTYSTAQSGDITRMPPGKFMVVTFDSLFNNPYGQSVLRPIADMTETYDKVYEAWRMGLVKAGFGSWIGTFGNDIAGDDSHSKAARAAFLESVQSIANGTASVFHENRNVRAEKLQFDAAAFLNFHTSYVQAVSVLLTGNATALIEGKFGSFAKEESTSVREKSDKEQADALLMGSAFTYQFNRFFMAYNYGVDVPIPQLQLIRPELIMPTTPQGQETQTEVEDEEITLRIDDQEEETGPAEMAEGDADKDEKVLRRTFDAFPDDTEEPELFRDVEDVAREYLETLPVKNYNDVSPNEAANVFTVRRLRNFDDAQAIQEELLAAIIPTVSMKTEAEAWASYLNEAEQIFKRRGLILGSSLQSDLIISFRQARQNAISAGIEELIDSNPDGLTGIMTQTMEDDRVRPVHKLWNGVVLAPDDPRREKLKKPMDFGCRCYDVPVYNNNPPLTPESEIPAIFPGESYCGYVA